MLELEGKHSKELAAKAADIAALRSQEAKGQLTSRLQAARLGR